MCMFAILTISKLLPNWFFKLKLLSTLHESIICSIVSLIIGIFFILHFGYSSRCIILSHCGLILFIAISEIKKFLTYRHLIILFFFEVSFERLSSGFLLNRFGLFICSTFLFFVFYPKRCKTFVKYTFCKYSFLLCEFPFHSLNGDFHPSLKHNKKKILLWEKKWSHFISVFIYNVVLNQF